MSEQHFNALPAGYALQEYTIKSVLGHGGFGITYLAFDNNLGKDVAIKEYLPAEFAVRQAGETVKPRSTADNDDYEWGLDRFLKEAQTLAIFRHPSIVPCYRFFKANGTAYMVMEYQRGDSLASLMRKHRGEFTQDDLLGIALPILDGLSAVHRANYLHRDLKPGNIFIREDGTPVLLDFGAARSAVGRKSKNLTSIVTPGYAPLEQYFADGNQGPWTDIYAMAAILYQAVAGKIPPEAPARVKKDPYQSVVPIGRGRFSEPFLRAIDAALAVEEERRPQSVEQWRAMLMGEAPAAAADPVSGGGQTIFAQAAPVAAAAAGAPSLGRPSAGPRGAAPSIATPTMQQAGAAPPRRRSGVATLLLGLLGTVVVSAAAVGGWYAADPTLGGMLASRGTTEDPGKKNGEPKRTKAEIERAEREAREAEARRKQEEDIRKAEERRKQLEEEAKAEEEKRRAEDARKREEIERRQREEAERRQLEERRKKQEEEARKAEEKRQREEAERRLREEAERRQKDEAERKKQEEADKRSREEGERRRAEEARREEERRKREEATRGGSSCPMSAAALNGHYAETDCFYVQRTVASALQTGTVGSTSRWSNSRSGNSGTITIQGTTQQADGTFCRRFVQTVTAGGQTRTANGVACLRNGSWTVTG